MKESLTSFDIRVLVGELQALVGAYLDKVYQEGETFLFRFNVPGDGKPELYVEPGQWLFLGEGFEHPPQPPTLAQSLRSAVQNARVRGVRQKGFDRIVLMDLEKEAPHTLVLEMFGQGNLVLLRDGDILHVLNRARWRAREVRPGVAYKFPPAGVDPTEVTVEGFAEVLEEYRGPVVKALASGVSLGGLYAEELCLRAGLPKDRACGDLTPEEVEGLYGILQTLLREADDPAPLLVRQGGQPVDAIPFDLRVYEDLERAPMPTLSHALRALVEARREEAAAVSPAVARLERRIQSQEETLRETEEGAGLAGRAADRLYAHYQEVDRMLRAAREGSPVEGADPAQGTLRLPLEGEDVVLDLDEDLETNARRLYERKKELTERAARIREALEESRREAARAREAAEREEARPPARPSYPTRRKFWFDAYRWTLSSEGFLILAGRDARSNEKLVRKHLEARDRYVHAEIPGAPSVVVKEGAEAGEATLREACRFALVHSKAWQLGLGSGSAYWVTPEQVSKTAQSGEYLRTGSFVIRGTRNYAHNLELLLGVGEVEYEGALRLVGGDPDALETLAPRFVILKPAGPVSRQDLIDFLSSAFEVPPEDVSRILPTGTFEVVKAHGVSLEGWAPRGAAH